jgi:hypothetical protein
MMAGYAFPGQSEAFRPVFMTVLKELNSMKKGHIAG